MLLVHVLANTGHPEGGHLQRNTLITNAVKDGYGFEIQFYQLKYCKNI
jgi:hypothetical protein